MSEYGQKMTKEPSYQVQEVEVYYDGGIISDKAVSTNDVLASTFLAAEVEQQPPQTLLTQQEGQTNSLPPQSLLHPLSDRVWAEQPTWKLPAISKPIVADMDRQRDSSSQDYLRLALDMVKSSGIYALGAYASPIVSLIITPFLAHHLSGTDYGGLSVLYTIVDLMTVMTQLGLSIAFFRAYNGDYEAKRDRLGVLASSIIILLLVSIPVGVAMIIIAPFLSKLLFGSLSFTSSVRLTALLIILENLTLPGISWLRAERRPVFYSILSVANLLLVLGTNIVLVGEFHMGVNGALLAKGAGFSIIVIGTFPLMLLTLVRERSFSLRIDIVRSMLFFGVPTIFSDMAAWILQLSDRYLLSHFGSLTQTASYTVAYTLGGILSPLVLTPFGLAWIPVMYAIAKRKDATHIFRLVFRWYSLVLLFSTFALTLLGTAVLYTLFPPTYYSAAPVIPLIALSTLLMGTYFIFMIGVNIRRKTIYDFFFTTLAATLNVTLNIFLIPHFGVVGAAVSTLLAYILLTTVTYIFSQSIYPIQFEIGPFIFRLFVGMILYIGSSVVASTQQPLIGWSISASALVVYGIFLVALTGLSVKHLKKLSQSIQAARRRRKIYAE